MKVLLHTCCGPCTIYPLRMLREEGLEVMGFFYRHNIHPYTECLRRQDALLAYAESNAFRVIVPEEYDMEGFLRSVVFRESNRCDICYHHRLQSTAKIAKKGRFDAFSTTLLYSKHQRHDRIQTVGEAVAAAEKIPFLYRDYRKGWKEGIDVSRRMGMYRQAYCGCIYSEKERFCKPGSNRQPVP